MEQSLNYKHSSALRGPLVCELVSAFDEDALQRIRLEKRTIQLFGYDRKVEEPTVIGFGIRNEIN